MAKAPVNSPKPGMRRLFGQPRWLNATAAWVPVLACFLGGATAKWAEGFVVLAVGTLLLLDPPLRSAGRWLNLILLGLIVAAATTFLPATFFQIPDWRTALSNDFGITLAGTVSPQPWVSLGALLSFIAALAWLYAMIAGDFELREVRFQLRLFASGIILLAALSIALYLTKTALPFWHNERGFGPFPNRNQTANLFGITAVLILACVEEDARRRNWFRALYWTAGLGVVTTALIFNYSRAGIGILIAGSMLWLTGVILRRASLAKIGIGLAAILGLLALLLVFGGETLERFQLRGGGGAAVTSDFRWLIFQDTFRLISTSPLIGIGLGNFEHVFAIFRDASIGNSRALHPESDWLWLLSEAGWAAVILTLLGLVLLLKRVLPLREGTNQRLRIATLLGALLFALHGLVDVGGHRVGTAYAAIFLLGMSLHRPFEWPRSRLVPVLFRFVGIFLLATGLTWIIAAKNKSPLPGRLGAEHERYRAVVANRGRDYQKAVEHANRGLRWTPLDWQLYFVRGAARLGSERSPEGAIQDFRRARFLEPNSYQVPLEEGRIWMNVYPTYALTAWRETLRRAGSERVGVYSYILSIAPLENSQIKSGLEALARSKPDTAFDYFRRLSREELSMAIAGFLENNPGLQKLASDEREEFLTLWAERGDADAFGRFLEQHPELAASGWKPLQKLRAQRGDIAGAVELAHRFAPKPTLPELASHRTLEELQRAAYSASDDFASLYLLYREQVRLGRTDDALLTLRRATESGNAPGYFHYLEAEAWAARQDWERSWQAWQKYLSSSNKAAH